jgi:hypothetical protein
MPANSLCEPKWLTEAFGRRGGVEYPVLRPLAELKYYVNQYIYLPLSAQAFCHPPENLVSERGN